MATAVSGIRGRKRGRKKSRLGRKKVCVEIALKRRGLNPSPFSAKKEVKPTNVTI